MGPVPGAGAAVRERTLPLLRLGAGWHLEHAWQERSPSPGRLPAAWRSRHLCGALRPQHHHPYTHTHTHTHIPIPFCRVEKHIPLPFECPSPAVLVMRGGWGTGYCTDWLSGVPAKYFCLSAGAIQTPVGAHTARVPWGGVYHDTEPHTHGNPLGDFCSQTTAPSSEW